MVRPADTEMTIMNEEVYSHRSRGTGGLACHSRGPHGEALGVIRRQREQGDNGDKRLYCGFHGKKWVK